MQDFQDNDADAGYVTFSYASSMGGANKSLSISFPTDDADIDSIVFNFEDFLRGIGYVEETIDEAMGRSLTSEDDDLETDNNYVALEEELNSLHVELDDAIVDNSELQMDLDTAQEEIEELKAEIARLQEQNKLTVVDVTPKPKKSRKKS